MNATRLCLIAVCASVFCGCRFSREIVNPDVRALDVAWVEPGVTTRADVVSRLGMPPTVRGMGGVGKDQFRWTMIDTMTKSFEAGYILTPTFEFADEDYADDILIRFDSQDRVTLVSRVVVQDGRRRQVLWKESRP